MTSTYPDPSGLALYILHTPPTATATIAWSAALYAPIAWDPALYETKPLDYPPTLH
jgi:hypothetical protein